MPTEDKLSHDERLRLEALAQAIQSGMMGHNDRADTIVQRANIFEAYIRNGVATQANKAA